MTDRAATLDVAHLPDYGFGHRSPMWWGTAGMLVIEGMGFALLLAAYIYLRTRVPHWPPGVPPPALTWGTLNLVLMLVTLVPNQVTKRLARRLDRRALVWLGICIALAFGLIVVRALEFGALNVRWDTNAYGSIVWMLVGLHTTHLVTDLGDSIVLLWFAARGPLDGERFVDITENAIYWYFVVLSWLPIYLLVYAAPRIL